MRAAGRMMAARVAAPKRAARFRALARGAFRGTGGHGTERFRFDGLEVWTKPLSSPAEGALYLFWVGTSRPGRGEGSAGMRRLAGLADEAGVALCLHADPWGRRGRMTREALRSWYERFGFEAGPERLVPYWPGRLGLEMWRRPGKTRRDRFAPSPVPGQRKPS